MDIASISPTRIHPLKNITKEKINDVVAEVRELNSEEIEEINEGIDFIFLEFILSTCIEVNATAIII